MPALVEWVNDMTTSYPLRQIEIDGFRGFRNFTLPDLGGVNVLVGGNNSGKTSVLEAVSMICNPCSPEFWLNMTQNRDPGGMDESLRQSLRWCFHQDTSPAPDALQSLRCTFRAESGAPYHLAELQVEYEEFLGEPDPAEIADQVRPDNGWQGLEVIHTVRWTDLQGVMSGPEGYQFRMFEKLPLRPRVRTFSGRSHHRLECDLLHPYSFQFNRRQVVALSRLAIDDGARVVSDLLREFDPEVLGVEVKSLYGDRPAIYLNHRRLGVAPLSIFGDAMRRSVLLASTLAGLSAHGVLLIDEAEAGIHADAQSNFFRWLIASARQRQVQVFLTTHSLETVDALLSAMPDDAEEEALVVYRLEKHPSGASHKRFAGDLLRRIRFNRGWDVR
jgi:AAA domain, putative AbiEii toxin, Type IV TA system/AAA ATPase domain